MPNGDYISNFRNVAPFPCDKRVISSMESSILQAQKMQSNIKLTGRYPRFEYRNGDRFLFLEGQAMQDILYLSHFEDKDGRKEYGSFYCDSGRFTSIATQGLDKPVVFAKSTSFLDTSGQAKMRDYGDIDFMNSKNLKQPLIKNVSTFTDLDFNLPSYSSPVGIIRSYDPDTNIIQFDRDVGQQTILYITSVSNFGVYELEPFDLNQFMYRVDADVFSNEHPEDTFSADEELTLVELEDENFNFLEFQTPLYLTFFEDIGSVKGRGILKDQSFDFTKINDRQFVTESTEELIEISATLL